MGATGHFMTKKGGSGSHQKEITVSAADTTIDVERVEEGGLIDFKLKTTFDGLETLGGGSGSRNGYFRVVHVKFNNVNRRYRLVCILNGGSYSYCRKDFAFYHIKMGLRDRRNRSRKEPCLYCRICPFKQRHIRSTRTSKPYRIQHSHTYSKKLDMGQHRHHERG